MADIIRRDNGDGTTTFDDRETVNTKDADKVQKHYKNKGYNVIPPPKKKGNGVKP